MLWSWRASATRGVADVAMRAAIFLNDLLSSIAKLWFSFWAAYDSSTQHIHHPKYQKNHHSRYQEYEKKIMPDIKNTSQIQETSSSPHLIRAAYGISTQGTTSKSPIIQLKIYKIGGKQRDWSVYRYQQQRNHSADRKRGTRFILTGQQVWESSQEYWGSEHDFLLGSKSKALALNDAAKKSYLQEKMWLPMLNAFTS